MQYFQLIDSIDVTHRGPEVYFQDDHGWQEVHIAQGDLDGACGPYCVFMMLILNDLIVRNELLQFGFAHGNSRFGRLQRKLVDDTGLFGAGTDIRCLYNAINDSYGKVAKIEYDDGRGRATIDFVVSKLRANQGVIVGIDGKKWAHWVLAVGMQIIEDDSGSHEVSRIFALDPSLPAPRVCGWNRIIDVKASSRGRLPYYFWPEYAHGEVEKVQIAQALTMKSVHL